jgi:RNA polymerase sigma-70 factor (ECF subfamily)
MITSAAMTLVEQLVAERPELGSAAAGLEDALVEVCARAERPSVRFSREAFLAHLARHLPEGDLARALAAVHASDLFLAGACAVAAPGALETFERDYGGEVGRAVRRSGSAATVPDDVAQALREKLFAARPGERPKIAEYSGQGPLRVWVRVVVTRMVQNLSMRAPKESPLDGAAIADMPATTGDPVLDGMRERYREPFRAAFVAAVASLDMRDRVLLHQRFASHKTQEELAQEYGVHVNTVARWLARARQAVEERTRAELRRLVHVGEGEFTSILRLVGSQLDLTLGEIE